MKKVAILTIILGFSTLVISCKKCQECTTKTSQTMDGYTQSTSSTQEYCGDSYDEAPTPGTYSNTSGSIQQNVTITCSDK